MNAYVKWLSRRGETFEDKEKGLPAAYLGRTMISHGEDFENDSEFGNCLIGTWSPLWYDILVTWEAADTGGHSYGTSE